VSQEERVSRCNLLDIRRELIAPGHARTVDQHWQNLDIVDCKRRARFRSNIVVVFPNSGRVGRRRRTYPLIAYKEKGYLASLHCGRNFALEVDTRPNCAYIEKNAVPRY